MILAGIDIGTLTCRLLIAAVEAPGRGSGGPLSLKELYSDRRVLRLGEGLDRTGRLQPAAMDRVIATLKEWRQVVAARGAQGVTVVATSAVREAANRDDFLDRLRRETDWSVEVISGEEEARRTLLGIRSGLPQGVERILGLDIGGGSTEFIFHAPGQPLVARSFEVGVVRLAERLFIQDPPAAGEVKAAEALIREVADRAAEAVGDLAGATFVGTAGTVTTLAAMAQGLAEYLPARVHNYRLELSTIRALEARILGCSKAQRRSLVGLEPGREDVIVAGTLILRTSMERLGFQTCLVSDLGLREGVVLDYAARLLNK